MPKSTQAAAPTLKPSKKSAQAICAEKTVIVTGAGSGIGQAVALKFLENGYRVAFAGRRIEALNESIKLAKPKHRKLAIAVSTDVSQSESVEQLFDTCWSHWGRLDVLFNNAGVGAPAVPLETLTAEQWKNVVDINLSGSFYCTQQAFRLMQKTNPRADASLTMVLFQPLRHGPIQRPTRRQNMQLLA